MGAFKRRGDDGFAHDLFERSGIGQLRVFVQQARQHRLIEATPVDADADRLLVAAGELDHLGELRIALGTATDIPGIDAVFAQCLCAGGIFFQQLVAVEMKVANDRHHAALGLELFTDAWHRLGRGFVVDGDADQFRTRTGQFVNLLDRAANIGGIGIRHGLDDDRSAPADLNLTYLDANRIFSSDHLLTRLPESIKSRILQRKHPQMALAWVISEFIAGLSMPWLPVRAWSGRWQKSPRRPG